MVSTKEHRIFLRPDDLAIKKITPKISAKIKNGLGEINGEIRLMLAATINTHTEFIDDKQKLKEKFAQMEISLKEGELNNEEQSLTLTCKNVPTDCLLPSLDHDLKIDAARKSRMAKVIRDVLLPPEEDPDDVKAHVKAYIKRTGLLDVEPRPRTFVWGGHSLPGGRNGVEYQHAKEIGYWDALVNLTEFITGCGEGIMRAPFSGAKTGYDKRSLIWMQDRFGIGLTEQKILAAEPPNSKVNRLVVFPDIALRIVGFILTSQRGRVHPGGAGTLEEIMSFLAIKSHDNNRDLHYPFDLVEPKGSLYMHAIKNYLQTCFKGELNQFFKIHNGPEPKKFAEHVLNTNDLESTEKLWNDDIFIPKELQKPFEATFKNMENLDLSRNQDIYSLVVNLRNFYSGIVDLTVKNPQKLGEWGKERPLIKGEPDIINATTELIKAFYEQGRICTIHNTNKENDLPFRTE